jgi:hypothetical protein
MMERRSLELLIPTMALVSAGPFDVAKNSETSGGIGAVCVERDWPRSRGAPAVEEGDGHLQSLSDLVQAARANAIGALFS